jgi:VWFA-related protein
MVGSAFRRILGIIAVALLVVPSLAQAAQQSKDTALPAKPDAKQDAKQNTDQNGQQDAIKLNTELVVVDAQVIDKRSHEFIRGLKPQDFDLLEDEARQRIEFFGQDQLPLSIVLLVDISPSVRPVIQKIRDGALQALQHLKQGDEVALMVFCGWTEMIQDFTKDRQVIVDQLGVAMQKKGGGTRIHEAIAKAARQMRYATNPASRRVIIAITDNQGSMDRYRDAISEEEVSQTVMESGATVCAVIVRSLLNVADDIIFQTPQIQDKWKRTSVNPYAEQTGGEVASASKDEINVRLGEVLDHLRSRYSLGYVSTNQNHNGKFRRIKLALSPEARRRLGGEITVNARQGYYAVDEESEALLGEARPAASGNGNIETGAPASPPATKPAASASAPMPANPPPDTKPVDFQVAGSTEAPQLEAFNPYSHLVMMDVLAMNRKTTGVIDSLARDDFELTDNGAKADIIHFSRGELPLSVILLVDAGGKTPYVMSCLRRNIAGWLRELRPDDEIALMAFGSTTAVIQDFTRDRKVIAAGLRDFTDIARQKGVGNGQDRAAAVFQAADHMDQAANPISRRVIITVTDDAARTYTAAERGATARLLLESRTSVCALVSRCPRPSRKHEVVSVAARGVLFGMGNPVSIATQIATKLAADAVMAALMKDWVFLMMIHKTGGIAIRVDGEDATDKLVLMLNHIKGRYVVGFVPGVAESPPSVPTAAAFHSLKLKLTPEAMKRYPQVSIAATQGYYLEAADQGKQPSSNTSPGKDH